MRNRKERQYVGKDDSMTEMTDITETSDIFSGHYESQIILFLVTVNFCNYAFLEPFWNQTLVLQNMVITLNFINLCNAATIMSSW